MGLMKRKKRFFWGEFFFLCVRGERERRHFLNMSLRKRQRDDDDEANEADIVETKERMKRTRNEHHDSKKENNSDDDDSSSDDDDSLVDSFRCHSFHCALNETRTTYVLVLTENDFRKIPLLSQYNQAFSFVCQIDSDDPEARCYPVVFQHYSHKHQNHHSVFLMFLVPLCSATQVKRIHDLLMISVSSDLDAQLSLARLCHLTASNCIHSVDERDTHHFALVKGLMQHFEHKAKHLVESMLDSFCLKEWIPRWKESGRIIDSFPWDDTLSSTEKVKRLLVHAIEHAADYRQLHDSKLQVQETAIHHSFLSRHPTPIHCLAHSFQHLFYCSICHERNDRFVVLTATPAVNHDHDHNNKHKNENTDFALLNEEEGEVASSQPKEEQHPSLIQVLDLFHEFSTRSQSPVY